VEIEIGDRDNLTLSVSTFARVAKPPPPPHPPPPPAPPPAPVVVKPFVPPGFSFGVEENCDSIDDMDEWYREYERLCLSVVSLPACIYLGDIYRGDVYRDDTCSGDVCRGDI
jgi:hypothetical protein